MTLAPTITTHKCRACDRWIYGERTEVGSIEIIDDGVPETYYACSDCVSELGKTTNEAEAILYALSMDDMSDESMHHDGWGYCARFGNWILTEDTAGFLSTEEHADEAVAEDVFAGYYMAGWGADEFDAYIFSYRGRWEVSFDGKHEGTFATRRRAMAKISLLMREHGYFPDVWEEDRGYVTHIGKEVWLPF